jgi:hypothetical protein
VKQGTSEPQLRKGGPPESEAERAIALSAEEIFSEVLRFERNLKFMIHSVLDSTTRRGAGIPRPIRERLSEELERRERLMWGPKREVRSLLDLATMGDLENIIAGNWKDFEPIFGDKGLAMAKLTELRLFRNALAHGTVPTTDDRVRILLLVRDLDEKIPLIHAGPRPTHHRSTEPEPGPRFAHVRAAWIPPAIESLRGQALAAGLAVEPTAGRRVRGFAVRRAGRTVGRLIVGQTSLAFVSGDETRTVASHPSDVNLLRDEIRRITTDV